jgi:hypothetical protein
MIIQDKALRQAGCFKLIQKTPRHEKIGLSWAEVVVEATVAICYTQEGRVARKAKLAKLVEPCNHAALIQQSKSNGFH